MTANVVHPAELERILQARVETARAKRATGRRAHARPGARRARRGSMALFAGLTLALSAAAVWASHGSAFIDLTADEAQVTHNDAIFTQGGLGAGTGNFDPYLTLSPGGSTPTEAGYNVCSEPVFGFNNADIDCPDPEFDEQTGGDRTHELLVSSIPVVEASGGLYREFHLDSNDAGSDPWMAITAIQLYLESDPDLTFAEFTATGDLIWDLDGDGGQTILMNTQSLESGSGVSDISILIPNDLFPADCFYGSTECETFLYFYTEAGDPELELGGNHAGKNWNTTAGFEEWRIELLPVVQVTKDVDISLDRTYPWDVAKSADVESIDLFAGETATINWTVTATVGTPVDSNVSVTGEIDILNPTGAGFAISDAIDAVVTDVEDVLTLGGVDTTATVTCPDPFPFTVDPGDTVTCTYTADPSSTDDGTNEATVTIETNEEGDTQDYTATAPVAFGDATIDEIDECVEVTDDNATPLDDTDDLTLDAELCAGDSPGVYPFSTQVGPFAVADCDSVTITNTAFTVTNDTDTEDEASDSVDVNCFELTVTKDADPTFSVEYDWTITKTVDPTSLDLFDGDSDDVTWTVVWDRDNGTPLGHAVSGTITIDNPAPIAADDVSVVDSLTGGINATVDCDPLTMGDQTTVDVPAEGSATCEYSTSLPDGTTRTNTATATLFGEEYSGTASVDFTGVNPTEIDATATITDDRGPLNQLESGDGSTSYPETFTCGEDEGNHVNTAVVTETDTGESANDPADVTVTCHELTVTKDANTSFDRDYDWVIEKTRVFATDEVDGDLDPTTLTLDPDQIYTLTYEIEVDLAAIPFVDSNWAVEGTITVDNPAPIAADDVVVSDSISGYGAADFLDCDPVTLGEQTTVDIAAGGSVDCAYSAALPDASDRTNTATATLFGVGYDGTADVLFAGADITEIDECITVVDDNGTPLNLLDDVTLGTVCADDPLPHTFTHTIDVGPFEVCGIFEFTNTASFTTVDDDNDTDESGSADYTVIIDVPCPEGCTLTLGYWKTHNTEFWGGAANKADPTWLLLGPLGPNTPFFDTGDTWFEVFWTNVAGRPYYQLAHQWQAAYLNTLSIQALGGTIPSEVQDALDDGAALLDEYDGSEAGKNPDLKGKGAKDIRAEFVGLAGILGSFNEGDIGPGHCDDDGSSTETSGQLLIADRQGRFSIG